MVPARKGHAADRESAATLAARDPGASRIRRNGMVRTTVSTSGDRNGTADRVRLLRHQRYRANLDKRAIRRRASRRAGALPHRYYEARAAGPDEYNYYRSQRPSR